MLFERRPDEGVWVTRRASARDRCADCELQGQRHYARSAQRSAGRPVLPCEERAGTVAEETHHRRCEGPCGESRVDR